MKETEYPSSLLYDILFGEVPTEYRFRRVHVELSVVVLKMDTTLSQTALNEYLQEKNVNALFVQIVQAMLIEKPENPILFTYQYLQYKYPDVCNTVPQEHFASTIDLGKEHEAIVADTDNCESGSSEKDENAYSDTDEDDDDVGEVKSKFFSFILS